MDTNQMTTWNEEKNTARDEHNIIYGHHQIPMGVGIWSNYQQHSSSVHVAAPGCWSDDVLGMNFEEDEEELGAMKEMMYKMAAMQPVDIDPASVRKPKRRNVRISEDPQSVAARHRRERISEKIGILQRLVPGGTKMDTASMLDEAIRYVKFLKRQIRLLQSTPPLNSPSAPNLLHASTSSFNTTPVIGIQFNATPHSIHLQ
ncbi:hypothetical protein VNO78_02066 [Psophocarpus tetragonolobus]|uniref:BHLH domain-containing protein n=1 Tax=Psophocarpus tetragonolobus TaxID=3891 RepID=A0AAN9T123_PSOTE